MEASLKSCGLLPPHVLRQLCQFFLPLVVNQLYRLQQELHLHLVLYQKTDAELLSSFRFCDGWKFIKKNIALYRWQPVDSIVIDR